jgi:hypothetical protein
VCNKLGQHTTKRIIHSRDLLLQFGFNLGFNLYSGIEKVRSSCYGFSLWFIDFCYPIPSIGAFVDDMNRLEQIQGQFQQLSISVQVSLGAVVLGLLYVFLTRERPHAGIPVVTLERKGLEAWLPDQFSWFQHGRTVLSKGLRDCPSCFQVRASSGYKIVVPNRFAEELRSDPNLSLNENFAKDFFINYPGFDGHRQGLRDGSIIHQVVRTKLTQSLGMITPFLIDETLDTLRDIFGDEDGWQTRLVKEDIADMVARLTSRVFLGSEICRNKEWLEVAKNYAMDSFVAQNHLRMCPAPLRPLLHWIIPSCARLRKGVRNARRLIDPEVQARRKRAEEAIRAGQKPPKEADAIGWMVEVAGGKKIDHVGNQLSLSILAIFSTSETLTRGIVQLCETPKAVESLREEIIRVLQTEGWSKVTVGKMRLLDSFLKEVQRTRCLDLSK